MIRPGLFAGGTIVFIWSLTDIGTPLIVGYQELTPVTIFKEISRGEVAGRIFSLVFLLLSGSVTLYVLGKFLFGRQILAASTKTGSASSLRRLGPLGTLGAWLLFGSVLFVSVLPHVGVVLLSVSRTWVNTVLPSSYTLEHLEFVLIQPATYTSILNSLRYASVSTAADLILGGLAAWLIVRTRLPGRSLLDGLAMLPLAVPGLILAAGYVAMTVTGAWLEELGPMGSRPYMILIIAYTVRRLPFAVRSISAGLQQVPESLEEASRNLGAGRVRTAGRITLPLIAANVIAAAVLTFAFAMLEVSDSLVLAQQEQYYPITKQIYELGTSTGSPETTNQAAALGVYAMGLLAATMGTAGALLGKRLGAIFRA
jgi:iron(III) transport system permease protein